MEGQQRTAWWIPVVMGATVVLVLAWLTRPTVAEDTGADAPAPLSPATARPADVEPPPPAAPPAGTAPTPPPPEAQDDPSLAPTLAELGPSASLAPVVGARDALATAASVAADRAADRTMGRLERAVAAMSSRTQWSPDVRLKVEAELDAVADALDEGVASVADRTQTLGVVVPNMDALAEQAARRISDVVGEPVAMEPLEPAAPAPGTGSWEGIPIDAWAPPPTP